LYNNFGKYKSDADLRKDHKEKTIQKAWIYFRINCLPGRTIKEGTTPEKAKHGNSLK